MHRIVFAIMLVVLLPFFAQAAAVSNVGNGASITVKSTVVQLDDPSIGDNYARHLIACVPSTESAGVFVGGKGVTADSGIPVDPGACYSIHLAVGAKVFAVSSGSVKVRVQEVY